MEYSIRHQLSRYMAPTFHGMTLGRWYRLFKHKNIKIDFPYHYRLLPTTIKSMTNSVLSNIEYNKYHEKYESIEIKSPIFIIGHWRSGTTLLQNIVANDHRFSYPNLYQVSNPHTFLISEKTPVTRLFSCLVPKQRLFDKMPFGLKVPHEDEFIAWHGSGLSSCLSWNFPKLSNRFDRYLSLKNVDDEEIRQWKNDLITFLKKLTYKYNKPIVLKSPQHTARIQYLLQLFPDARFIHIYRNPYRVYQSTKKMNEFVLKLFAFQKYDLNKFHRRILDQYKEMYTIFFNEKKHIPNEQLIEIKFESFEKKPMELLKKIYQELDLPDYHEVKDKFNIYLQSVNSHKKNYYPDMTQSLKNEIYENWRQNFEIWGYEH